MTVEGGEVAVFVLLQRVVGCAEALAEVLREGIGQVLLEGLADGAVWAGGFGATEDVVHIWKKIDADALSFLPVR